MLSLALTLALFAPCSPSDTTAAERPDDFTLHYQWDAGSLPPPYGYQVQVSVEADGSGTAQIQMNGGGPTWSEPFRATAEQMDETYKAFCESGVYVTEWQEPDAVPVGGSSWRLRTSALGDRVVIPPYATSSPARSLDQVVDAVEEIVPRRIWQKLEAQRDTYMADQRGSGPSAVALPRR
ncbi:MAG: hypothetical protein Rubg2KO_12400 [Rubricoccaceae bacterium]